MRAALTWPHIGTEITEAQIRGLLKNQYLSISIDNFRTALVCSKCGVLNFLVRGVTLQYEDKTNVPLCFKMHKPQRNFGTAGKVCLLTSDHKWGVYSPNDRRQDAYSSSAIRCCKQKSMRKRQFLLTFFKLMCVSLYQFDAGFHGGGGLKSGW